MDVKSLLNEAVKMSKWEKIESGIHNFTLTKIENRLTEKSKRDAIVYTGTIKNSKGVDQIVTLVDVIDTEDGLKFAAARLIQFIQYFGSNVDSVDSIEQLIVLGNKNIGNVIKIEFVKKLVNGLQIKEKQFIFQK